MKPQPDDVERKVAALGFSLKKGTKPGAGYNLKHDATGEMPLGSDFRASPTEVDRYLEKRLLDMAQAFGLSLKKAERAKKFDDLTDNEARAALQNYSGNQLQRKEFFGYEVLNPKKQINTGEEVVLGQDHDASFEDVARYLQNLANDAGVDDDIEIDINKTKPRVAPPKPEKLREAASGHASKAEIVDLVNTAGKDLDLEPKAVTLDERRRRMALNMMLSTGRVGIDRLSPEFAARLKAAVAEEDRQSAERTPKTKRRIFDGKITIDDYAFEERRRQNNAFKNADRLFTRTSTRSRLDGLDLSLLPQSAVREHLKNLDLHDRDFLPPEANNDPAPKASTGFAVTAKRSRLSKDEVRRRQEEVRQASEIDKIAAAIRATMGRQPTPRRDADLGALLRQAKGMTGDFDAFVKALGMPRSSAYRFIKVVSK